MQIAAKLTGLAGLLTGGKGAATAAGAISGRAAAPATFAVTSRSSERAARPCAWVLRWGQRLRPRDLAAARREARPRAARGRPQARGRRSRERPPDAGGWPRALRPIRRIATARSRSSTARRGSTSCSATARRRTVEKPGYKGPVLVCNARYVPIAGHRSLRPSTKFMQENKDMQVWLAPVERDAPPSAAAHRRAHHDRHERDRGVATGRCRDGTAGRCRRPARRSGRGRSRNVNPGAACHGAARCGPLPRDDLARGNLRPRRSRLRGAVANTVECGANSFSYAEVRCPAEGAGRREGPLRQSMPDSLCADLIEHRQNRRSESLDVVVDPRASVAS